MPELPEVETIKIGLEKYLVGKKLGRVEVKLPKIVLTGSIDELVGASVQKVRRFGKVLVLDFSNSHSMVVHIKLTGQLIVSGVPPHSAEASRGTRVSQAKVGTLPNRWTHLILHFQDGINLFYNDIRQFGWIRVLPTESVEHFKFIHELGPEPFGELTIERFRDILKNRSTRIKPLLLDQTKIGGVGNIYANDALFLAKIDPQRSAKSLTEDEQTRLYEALLEVLGRGLEYGGASELTYVNALGEEGEYQKHFLAYAQNGKPCRNCGAPIKKIALGGRGTYFCENCQK